MPDAQIESLLEQDLDQILESFGTELEKQHLGARPKSREARINNARRWIEQRRADICRSLSKEPTLVAYICEEKMFGRVEAITAIIDALSGMLTGIALTTVSVIVFKQGIRELCPAFCEKHASS